MKGGRDRGEGTRSDTVISLVEANKGLCHFRKIEGQRYDFTCASSCTYTTAPDRWVVRTSKVKKSKTGKGHGCVV